MRKKQDVVFGVPSNRSSRSYPRSIRPSSAWPAIWAPTPPSRAFSQIDAALNERFSFQLAVRADADAKVAVSASAPEGRTVRIRRVGLVPMQHHNSDVLANPLDLDGIGSIPGLVPDPLFTPPLDSIRWEVFSEAMQDYALLQTLGVSRDDPLLAPLQSFSDFPKDARWRIAARRRLFASLRAGM